MRQIFFNSMIRVFMKLYWLWIPSFVAILDLKIFPNIFALNNKNIVCFTYLLHSLEIDKYWKLLPFLSSDKGKECLIQRILYLVENFLLSDTQPTTALSTHIYQTDQGLKNLFEVSFSLDIFELVCKFLITLFKIPQ